MSEHRTVPYSCGMGFRTGIDGRRSGITSREPNIEMASIRELCLHCLLIKKNNEQDSTSYPLCIT